MKRVEVRIAMDAPFPAFTVSGYEFEFDGIPFVVHRHRPGMGWNDRYLRGDGLGKNWKGWAVTEPRTGRAIPCNSETRRGACELADNFLRQKGADVVRRQIDKQLRKTR